MWFLIFWVFYFSFLSRHWSKLPSVTFQPSPPAASPVTGTFRTISTLSTHSGKTLTCLDVPSLRTRTFPFTVDFSPSQNTVDATSPPTLYIFLSLSFLFYLSHKFSPALINTIFSLPPPTFIFALTLHVPLPNLTHTRAERVVST